MIWSLAVAALAALSLLATQAVRAASRPTLQPRVLTTWPFVEPYGSFAESAALGEDGRLYASVTTWGDEVDVGQIVRISPRTGDRTPFGPSIETAGLLTGVAFDEHGRLYVANATFSDADQPGVFRVDQTGTTRVLTLPAESFPNGLAFRDGYLYVSDSALGAVWRARPGKSAAPAAPWFQDDLLEPGVPPEGGGVHGVDDAGIGANGIAFRDGHLYVASSDQACIVSIPILRNGNAGQPSIVAGPREELKSVDGIAFDLLGNLWLVTNGPGKGRLEVLTAFGTLFVLADAPSWLDYPTQPVFGTTPATLGSLYVANGSYDGGTPSLIAFGGPLQVP